MRYTKIKTALSLLTHFAGTAFLFLLFTSIFVTKSLRPMLFELLRDNQVSSQISQPLVVVFFLSLSSWLLLVFLFRTLSRPKDRKRLRRATGSIMTETLIILPVFFLLTSGLAQMGINSMAGLLTTVGAFEAGRTLAVWGPEIGRQRIAGKVITRAQVLERARIAVAAIVTPVARDGRRDVGCTSSATFQQFERGMAGALSPIPLVSLPSPGSTLGAVERYSNYGTSFGNLIGPASFALKGATKLKSAYCSVSIAESSVAGIPIQGKSGADFTVSVTYDHHPVFPLVQKIFNNTKIKRTYTTRSHLPSNDLLPVKQEIF